MCVQAVFHIWYHRELISERHTGSVFRPLYRVYIQGSFSKQTLFMIIVYCQDNLVTLMQHQTVIRFTVGRALDSTLNVAGVHWDQIAGAAFGAAPVNVNEPLTALKGQLWSVQVVLTKVPNDVTRSLTSSSVAYPVLSSICKIKSS